GDPRRQGPWRRGGPNRGLRVPGAVRASEWSDSESLRRSEEKGTGPLKGSRPLLFRGASVVLSPQGILRRVAGNLTAESGRRSVRLTAGRWTVDAANRIGATSAESPHSRRAPRCCPAPVRS